MKAEYSGETVSANSNKLVMHKDSHTITKLMKPKIRIIHIVAPEIIKTDVENFRDLVQRLTGKPAAKVKRRCNSSRKASQGVPTSTPAAFISSKLWTNMHTQDHHHHHQGIQIVQGAQRILKKERVQDIYSGESSSSNAVFNDGFGDVNDGIHYNSFIQDLTEYPNLLPFKSSQMNMFGEMHLC